MTSEAAAFDATTVDHRFDASAPAVLGRGMSHRARSQAVLGQRWSSSGLVGAVGRASIGFGLAIGRSRSIRPTVCFDDLNSAALRPSPELWRLHHRGDEDAGDVGDVGDSGVSGVSGDSGVAIAPAPTGARRAGGPGGRARAQPARRHPRPTSRPTWTDQIIQRSSVAFVASASTQPPAELAIPAGFVSSGDAKLDRLRLLVNARSHDTDVRADQAPGEVRRTTAANPTVSVGADIAAPGRLARSMRPESARVSQVPQARAGGGASLPPATTPRRSQRAQAKRAAEPTKLDRLRAHLVAEGFLEPDTAQGATGGDDATPAVSGTDGSRPDPPRSRGSEPRGARPVAADPTITTSTGAELRRAAADDTRRRESPTQPSPISPPSPGPQSSHALRLQRLLRSDGSGADDARPVDGPAGPARAESSTGPSELSELSEPSARIARSPMAAMSDIEPARSAFVASASTDTVGPETPSPATPGVRRSRWQPVAPTLVRPGTSTSVAPTTLVRPGTSTSVAPTTLVRRVTLPRALSSRHRPPTTIPSRAEPRRLASPVSSGHLAQRASVFTLAEASIPWPSTDRTHTSDPSASRPVASAGPAARRSTSAVPAGTGALLDVVRRSSFDERPSTAPRSTPDVRQLEHVDARDRLVRDAPIRPAATRRDTRPFETTRTVRAEPSEPTPGSATSREPDAPIAAPTAVTARVPVVDAAGAGSVDADHRIPGFEPDARLARPGVAHPIADSRSVAPAPPAPMPPAERVAAQFMTALADTVRRQPAPLPTVFRPMADVIAGPRPVMLSTDAASRRALRSVGKVAATTGDTIHLDRQAIAPGRLDEVMAHELTHIAHPSPTPRFFDDIDDSPEERRAEHVARVMARSPLAPSSSVVAPVGRDSGGTTLRRALIGGHRRTTSNSPASATPSISAEELAASLTGGNPSGRSTASPGAMSPAPARPSSPSPSGPRRAGTNDAAAGESASVSGSGASGFGFVDDEAASAWFRAQLEPNLDRLLRMVEDRMIVELERRGGRAWRQS